MKSEGRTGEDGKRTATVLGIILLLGLIVRIVYYVQLGSSDLGDLTSLDQQFYRELAAGLAAGGGLPAGALTFNPLYPLFLGLVFRLFGDGFAAPRLLQMAIGLLTIYLVYIAGRMLAPADGRRRPVYASTGLIAAAMMLLYPHPLLYEGSLLATTLVTFCLIASLGLALSLDRDLQGAGSIRLRSARVPHWAAAMLLGVIIGVGVLGRPNLFLLLAAAVPVWLFFRAGERLTGLRLACAAIAGAALLVVPPIVYNTAQTGRFVPVTAHGGINFYVGNRPDARPVYKPPEWMRRDMRGAIQDSKMRAEQELGRSLDFAEASNYWFRITLDEIAASPGRWMLLLAGKLRVFWNGVEVPDVIDISFYRRQCPVLGFLFLPFAVISPLALCGLVVLARRGKNRSIVFLYVGVSLASVLMAFVSSRYRMPSIPVLILCAALYVSWTVGELRAGRRRWAIAGLGLFALLLLAVGTPELVVVNHSATYTFMGNHYMQIKEEEKAEEAFAEAYRLDSESVENRINYARVLRIRGDDERSLELYASAFAADPDFSKLAIEYGVLLVRRGRRDEAERLFLYAYSLRRRDDRVLACTYLSRLAYAEGRLDDAVSWIRKGLEIRPGDRDMVNWLNRIEGAE